MTAAETEFRILFSDEMSQSVAPEIAEVVEFIPPTGDGKVARVNVQPLVCDSENRLKPQILYVPVLYPQGTSYGTWYALVPGDQVLLLFARGAYEWKMRAVGYGTEGMQSGADIGDMPRLNDAVAIPGMFTLNQSGVQLEAPVEDGAWIAGYKGTPRMLLQIRSTGIKLGTSSADLLSILDSILTALLLATTPNPLVDPVNHALSPAIAQALVDAQTLLATIKGT